MSTLHGPRRLVFALLIVLGAAAWLLRPMPRRRPNR